MKVILFLPLFFAVALAADQAEDRAAIEKVIAALNDSAERANLFMKDVDSGVNFDRLIDLHLLPAPPLGIGMTETWGARHESGETRNPTSAASIVSPTSQCFRSD
jgi:hypothetical protein